jgi:hypothetical protein
MEPADNHHRGSSKPGAGPASGDRLGTHVGMVFSHLGDHDALEGQE